MDKKKASEVTRRYVNSISKKQKPLCVLSVFAVHALRFNLSKQTAMIVENSIIIENKTVDKITPIHEAQLLTYLKITNIQLGFLLNWNVAFMKHGIKRIVNKLNE